MERILDAMVPWSPVGLAILACVAFGMALATREALGVERGLRAAAERARAAALNTLAANKDWEVAEIGRFRRLLDCHIDALIAEATEFRERSVPSPGDILDSLCSWHADWKRALARSAELQPDEVESLLANDLPITPSLARRLELFTGAPARYWEYLWRLHDEYRTETERTVVVLIDSASRACKPSSSGERPGIELIDDSPTIMQPMPIPWSAPSKAAERPAQLTRQPPLPRSAHAEPSTPLPSHRFAVEVHPPAVPHPEIAGRAQRGGLPPPPKPRFRSPLAPPDQGHMHGLAATLTDFPIQRGDAPAATEDA